MFVNFFYHLRLRGLPVTSTELLTLLEALTRGLEGTSLERFYAMARSVMVKRVEHYDLYDQAFAEFFKDKPFDLSAMPELTDQVLDWLQDPRALRALDEQERAMLQALDLDELRRQFAERLQEQTERHDGGSRWIGTGGTSPFGQGGTNPAGVRVGEGGQRTAVQVAQARRFRNLRSDMTLDVRQMGVALRKLRVLTRANQALELDIDETIDATAHNAGDLELIFRAPRKNNVKLLLLMDVGGSMTPYTRLSSQLFSAAHQATHFKQFESYYFHNCPYDVVYKDMERRQGVSTKQLLKEKDSSWTCIFVGDAAMAPGELMYAGGSIDLYHLNERSGFSWLTRIKETMPRSVWLNPDPPHYWTSAFTVARIQSLFEMFPLTLNGLEEAVSALRRKRTS